MTVVLRGRTDRETDSPRWPWHVAVIHVLLLLLLVVCGAHVFDNHGLLTKYYLPGNNSTRTRAHVHADTAPIKKHIQYSVGRHARCVCMYICQDVMEMKSFLKTRRAPVTSYLLGEKKKKKDKRRRRRRKDRGEKQPPPLTNPAWTANGYYVIVMGKHLKRF